MPATVLFQGDSITDAGRDHTRPADLGHGYAALAAAGLPAGLTVLNRGVSGNRLADLRDRWDADTLAHRPDLVSVLIGVNDTWRHYDSGLPSPADAWEDEYRRLLQRLHAHCAPRLVLIEPFLVPVTAEQRTWRQDLDPRIAAVHRLAAEHDALLLPADDLLNQAARTTGHPTRIAIDGVHPTPLGHRLLADAWLHLVRDPHRGGIPDSARNTRT
ncbi:SGNH/GDSL hydrolase family protein [Streptomyces sp. TLI_171]|uniref:SGNH/GDSL hydrolase family protein n=1 Tax=Streptomyces sp. TLI_171 TaxID=1938859 RepID=UPI000C19DB0E|nr:SGNH/GDSL hydrolase family protein [Streptomyces sp. TLI_171]RKE17818.1 lysophospholipase L1-like esterase [Streptomyces sp. TLI_171]